MTFNCYSGRVMHAPPTRDTIPRRETAEVKTPNTDKTSPPCPDSITQAWGKEKRLMRDNVITPDVWTQTAADTAIQRCFMCQILQIDG